MKLYCISFIFLSLIINKSYSEQIDNDEIECIPHNVTHMELAWNRYKIKYQKTYSSLLERRRKLAWMENCKHIYQHNQAAAKGIHSYTLRPNHLSDLTNHHYHRQMIKLTKSRRRKLSMDEEIVGLRHNHIEHLPKEIDWREKGFTTPPVDQRDCGSCYAFSIAHILEAQLVKETKKLIPLSEQQIIDCSTKNGNYGCNGGSLRNTLRYLTSVGGIEGAEEYPYEAKSKKCKFDGSKIITNITTWSILPARDEHALQKTVAHVGPVAVSINASPKTFQLYHKGIYSDDQCSSNSVNHAMIIVGYTRDAWILKNWWGEHWGENGYMRLRRHKNLCGIANYVAYVQINN